MRLRDMGRIRAWIRDECRAKGPGEHGIALISVILLILVLSFVSAATIVTSTTELKIGGNFKTSVQSFYNAEAGVQYALGQIRNKYAAGTLNLTGIPVVVHYGAPNTSIYPLLSNGKFPFSNWTATHLSLKTGTTTDYTFQTTGYYANSNTSLQVVLRMPSFYLVKGMFASGKLDIKNNINPVGSPSPEFGSNTEVYSKNTVLPNVVLGGSATYTGTGTPTTVKPVPTINPDPLGAASLVSDYSGSNDNASAGIVGNAISGNTTLPPGKYYLTSLTGNLTIDPSGPVTIYFHGSGTVNLNGAMLNSGGTAGNLSIICDTGKKTPTDPVPATKFDFKNSAGFTGLIYAPYADLEFDNNGNVRGLLWGKTLTVKNNMTFQYDAGAASFFGSALTPLLGPWKQL